MLDPADVTDEARLADLGLDSLGVVECLFAIEETFEVSVPFNANEPGASGIDLSTVGALIAGVESLIAAR
jgi:acyl carrier protein